MSRLRTIGFEARASSGATSDTFFSEGIFGFALETYETATVRSGSTSVKFTGNGSFSDIHSVGLLASEQASGRGYYGRVYVYIPSFDSSVISILSMGPYSARLTPSGTLQLFAVGVQIGSDSDVVDTGRWLRLELFCKVGAGATDACELKLDGVSIAGGSSLNVTDFLPSSITFGLGGAGGSLGFVLYFDDFALNDDQGSSQNSWPGEGKVVLSRPIGDSQRGSWVGGAGGTTSLFEAVNNTPPIGTASETNLTQIESNDTSGNNDTDEYRATMTDYLTAGVPSDATVRVVHALVEHGEDVATGTKTGSFRLRSNPEQVTPDTFEFGDNVGALGTWPVNWRAAWGTPQYDPSVSLGDSPVIALRKTDTGNRVASVDFIGAYVEYEEAAAAGGTPLLALLGVGR